MRVKERFYDVGIYWSNLLLGVSFCDGTDPVALGNLLPLGYGLARSARIVSPHVAALRPSDELLRR